MISGTQLKEFVTDTFECFGPVIAAVSIAGICIVAGFPWLAVIACIVLIGLSRYWYSCVFGLGNLSLILCALLFSFLCCLKDYKEILHDISTPKRERKADSSSRHDNSQQQASVESEGKTQAEIHSVVFSPDGALVAVGTLTNNAKDQDWLQIWDAQKNRILRSWYTSDGVSDIAFSRDGKRVAIAGKANVMVCDVSSAKLLQSFEPPKGSQLTCAFGKNSDEVIIGSDNLALWNVKTGKQTKVIFSAPAFVKSFAVSPDGRILASSHTDSGPPYSLWNLETNKSIRTLGTADTPYKAIFSRDSKWVAGKDGKGTHVWDAKTGKLIVQIGKDWGAPVPNRFSPDGRKLICLETLDEIPQIWDVKNGTGKSTSLIHGVVAISPDGKRVATVAPEHDIFFQIRDSDVKLF